MFTINEFSLINRDFNKAQQNRKKKLMKIWGILLGITLVLVIAALIIFPNQFDNGDTVWILPVYGGITLIVCLIGFFVSLKFLSEKPFFEYLYTTIIDKINREEGLFLTYESYEKGKFDFNKIGGIFPYYALARVKRHIKGHTEDQLDFDIYDTTITTSSNNSQQTHLDGIYYVLHKKSNTRVQVRAQGKPRVKGLKFEKLEERGSLKVYKEVGMHLNAIDYKLISFVENIEKTNNLKHVYLSVIEDEVHLALWHKKHPARKHKKVSLDILNQLYIYFMSELEQIQDLTDL
ncbi:MAG: hypothetical protein K8Q99_02545 [Acholeplasmataceae bacterium]|nr:hypothetical protein [Acholeplasmataceae bacterium]